MLMCHFTNKLKVEINYLFQNLTTSKNMMGGANASLQNLIITWANFIYLYNHNMQNMNVYSSIGEKIVANIITMGDVIGEEKRNCNLLFF